MSKREYRFHVETDAGTVQMFPRYKSDLSREYEPEPGQQFYRSKLSSSLTFQRGDFDAIHAAPLSHEFIVHIDRRIGGGAWSTDWFVGYFTKTDASEYDVDNKTVVIQPEPDDRYRKLWDQLDKEFNLIDLSPATVSLDVRVQPLVQVYVLGSQVVTNILSGTYWEEPVNTIVYDDLTIRTTYLFDRDSTLYYVPGGSGAGLSPDVSGYYDENGGDYLRQDGQYQFITEDLGGGDFRWTIIDKFDSDTVVYRAVTNEQLHGLPGHSDPGTLFTSETDPGSQVRVFYFPVYTRLLTSESTVGGSPTSAIPDPDITNNSDRYDRAIGLQHSGYVAHDGNSSSPDRWGKFDSNSANFAADYFTQPIFAPSSGVTQTLPVARSEWTEVSWWFYYDAGLRVLQQTASTGYTLRHAYKLADTITAVVNAIDPTVTHSEDANHSVFLYGTNSIRGAEKIPIISPKSNILEGEYDRPASRANIRLSDILGFLRDFYQVFPIIDDSNRFRLEHVDWFDRGGTYSGTNVSIDLTTQSDPKTGKPWGFRTASFKWDKSEMPERIVWRWMDEVSEVFEGFPVEVLSPYINRGSIDEKSLSIFTSDIDFIHAQGQSIAQDGFVFFEAEDKGTFQVPFVDLDLGYPNIFEEIQNGYASMIYAAGQYWKHHLPAESVYLNLATITATSIRKNRLQEITFPTPEDFDPVELITTSEGDAKVGKISENLSSGAANATLKHELE